MQRHHSVPGHESAMNSDEHRGSSLGHTLNVLNLDAPVVIVHEFEECAPICRDVILIHPEVVELLMTHHLLLIRQSFVGVLQKELRQRFGARPPRRAGEFSSNLVVRDRPGVAYVVELLYRTGQSEMLHSKASHPLEDARNGNAPRTDEPQRRAKGRTSSG